MTCDRINQRQPLTGRINLRKTIGDVLYTVSEDIAVRYFAVSSFKKAFGRNPVLSNDAICFSDKICRRKVYDRNSRMYEFADKVAVKRHVTNILGSDWVIPTVWSGKDISSVDLDAIEKPFVIKASHGSNWNVFVRSDADLDRDGIARRCANWMSRKYGRRAGEWLYLHIEPNILIEPFIGSEGRLPVDYKVFVFSGKAKFIQVDTDRGSGHKRCFYDCSWKKQPFGLSKTLEARDIAKPISISQMISASEILAKEFDFARVDFYEINGKPMFGEITFYPGSGLENLFPAEWEEIIGKYWT